MADTTDSPSNPGSVHICVCICTYRRPGMLKRLLAALSQLRSDGLFTLSVVVADNDKLESARSTVAEAATEYSLKIQYCVEPRQNIALVRNLALSKTTGDFVAFIDDDEFPAPDWLLLLLATCRQYGASGTLSPVEPHFDSPPPQWLVRGRFCHRPRHPTGHVLAWENCRTGSALLKRSVIDGLAQPFRPEYGSGGEDRDFFRRMIAAGHVFVWCDEAIAWEVVPPARWERRTWLRRALLRGKVAAKAQKQPVKRFVVSSTAVVVYALALPFLALAGEHHFMKYLIKLCDHAGAVLTVLGIDPVKEVYVSGE